MENHELDQILNNITADINKTLKNNLGSYFKNNNNNNKIINSLKNILFTMPEYINLNKDYQQLLIDYNSLKSEFHTLKSSNIKNIKMNIYETHTTPKETSIIKNPECNLN